MTEFTKEFIAAHRTHLWSSQLSNAALDEISRLQARIAELEAERRWIPVSEPPKESGVYITAYRSMFGGNNLITSTSYFKVEDGWTPGNVKYWQPIPQHTQEEE